MGFTPGAGGRDVTGILEGAEAGEIGFVYLLGADELPMEWLDRAFVVYQGHHGDAGAAAADVVLPGAAYTEKSGTYVNTEGRVQQGALSVYPPGEAREDWTIIRALSKVLGHKLGYDNLAELRAQMTEAHPSLAGDGTITAANWSPQGKPGKVDSAPFQDSQVSFYMTDPICRASVTMAKCAALAGAPEGKTGTDG